jgi:hypothetical protein
MSSVSTNTAPTLTVPPLPAASWSSACADPAAGIECILWPRGVRATSIGDTERCGQHPQSSGSCRVLGCNEQRIFPPCNASLVADTVAATRDRKRPGRQRQQAWPSAVESGRSRELSVEHAHPARDTRVGRSGNSVAGIADQLSAVRLSGSSGRPPNRICADPPSCPSSKGIYISTYSTRHVTACQCLIPSRAGPVLHPLNVHQTHHDEKGRRRRCRLISGETK